MKIVITNHTDSTDDNDKVIPPVSRQGSKASMDSSAPRKVVVMNIYIYIYTCIHIYIYIYICIYECM